MIYKLTGVMEDRKSGVLYREIGFHRNKMVIDFIMLYLCLGVVLWGTIIAMHLDEALHAAEANHYDRLKILGIFLLDYAVVLVIPWLLLYPLRAISGLRWYFLQFETVEGYEEKSSYHTYHEFYTDRIAFSKELIDHTIWYKDCERVKELITQYYSNDPLRGKAWIKIIRFLYDMMVWAIFLCIRLMLINFSTGAVALMSYGILMVLYALSHLIAWLIWTKHKTLPVVQKEQDDGIDMAQG